MRKLRDLFTMALVAPLSGCFWGEERVVSIEHGGLAIEATISNARKKLAGGAKAIGGRLRIENTSEMPVQYSNRNLFLVAGDECSRAYIDSFASHAIDFSRTTIAAKSTLELEVYWPVQEYAVDFEAYDIQWK